MGVLFDYLGGALRNTLLDTAVILILLNKNGPPRSNDLTRPPPVIDLKKNKKNCTGVV